MTFRIILAINFSLILVGCSNAFQNVSSYPDSSLNQNQQTSEKRKYTKEEAIATFKLNKDFSNYEISDYVLVNDDKIPMLKAVISFYDKKKKNSCNLAFIYANTSQVICFAENEIDSVKTYEIADNSKLTYVGDGTVTTTIRKIETNELIEYKINFSLEESTSTTIFKVEAEKPIK
ncbi:hypothetical protein ACNQFZ_02235 [Schinkia sp. CFF1]